MSVTLTKASATQNSLKYTFVANTATTGTRTLTQLLADCVAGPLKTLLTQVGAGLNAGVSGLTWSTLVASGLLSIYVTTRDSSGSEAIGVLADLSGNSPPSLLVNVFVSATTINGIVELRYHQTAVR